MIAAVTWAGVGDYKDIRYEHSGTGIARVTINRPEVHNAFRPETVSEMIDAFARIRDDTSIGCVLLTGAGDKAFCSGGDQRYKERGGYVGGDGLARSERPGSPAPDPIAADPGHRLRERLRHRRRPGPPGRVRPGDRRRQRHLRAGRPSGRQLRRRIRDRSPGPAGGGSQGEGDLVPVPPLRRRRRAGDGPGQPCRPPDRARSRRRRLGDRDPGHEPDRDPLPQVRVPGGYGRSGRAPGVRRQCDRSLLHDGRGARGLTRVPGEARPDFSRFPRRP